MIATIIAEAAGLGQRVSANGVAELFGGGNQVVDFKKSMHLRLSILGKIGQVEAMIYPEMLSDVLIGHDALMGCGVRMVCEKEVVASDAHSVRFGRRIDILSALLKVENYLSKVRQHQPEGAGPRMGRLEKRHNRPYARPSAYRGTGISASS